MGGACNAILLSALNTVTHLMNDGEDVNICFKDLSKTFDAVNHSFVYAKFAIFEVSPLDVGWISEFHLSSSSQSTRHWFTHQLSTASKLDHEIVQET